MISISDLKFRSDSLGDQFVLVNIFPFHTYANGVQTAEIGGFKYQVAAPSLGYEKFSVKIPGNKRLIELPPDKSHMAVEFDDLEFYVYWRDRQPQVGARAKNIRPVADKS